MKFILVRHSETYGNVEGRFNGITESPLTPRGEKMEEEVIKYLIELNKNLSIEKIFTSPSGRALKSAKKFSKETNIELEIVDELIEYDFGIFDGLTFKEARKIDNDTLNQWLDNSTDMSLPNGESFREKTDRVKKWVDKIIDNKYNTVIIFTHGATFRSILMELLELPLEQAWHFKVGLGSFCVINYENNFGELEEFINPYFKF